MVIMQDKVSNKLSEVFKSLQAAKKYGVDVRAEEKVYTECSIGLTKVKYSVDERFGLVNSELKKNEQERYISILNKLIVLENTILDKRKIYQVRETLEEIFKRIKGSESEEEIKGYIEEVKRELEIYNSAKILEIYSPEIVINKIFEIIYESIKIEWFRYGKSELLEMVMKNEASLNRISFFLGKDIETLERILGNDNKELDTIKKYKFECKEDSRKSLIDSKLIDMIVKAISSKEVENKINEKAKDIHTDLDTKVKEAQSKRNKYIGLGKLQNKIRESVLDIKRKIDRRVGPIALSLVIMSGIGFGTYDALSNSEKNTNDDVAPITEVNVQSNTRALNASFETKEKEEKNKMPLIIAGTLSLASAFIPRYGIAFQGVGLYKDRKKYNKAIEDIISKKHEMEDLKTSLETIVKENRKFIKEADKQKSRMMWASVYKGISAAQMAILEQMNANLSANERMLDYLDEEILEDKESKAKIRSLGQ